MNHYEIKDWNDIKHLFINSILILGNGSSIAVSDKFSYHSLKEYAKQKGFMSNDIKKLFTFYNDTDDFEFILRLVWQTTNVNKALNIRDDKTQKIYEDVRNCLIKTIQDIHPKYDEVKNNIHNISQFIKNFRLIFSLNYDLILYWAMMYSNNQTNYIFKDCFVHSEFDQKFMKFYESDKHVTLVFYPHGNLILAKNKMGDEFKISTKTLKQETLLENIFHTWEKAQCTPLFICEGTSQQKVNTINGSPYLKQFNNILYQYKNYHTIDELIDYQALHKIEYYNNIALHKYECILDIIDPFKVKSSYPYLYSNINSNHIANVISKFIVIYGWDIGDQDQHIINVLLKYKHPIYIAISVFNNDQEYCNRVNNFIMNFYKKLMRKMPQIIFFDSKSEGCWNNK